MILSWRELRALLDPAYLNSGTNAAPGTSPGVDAGAEALAATLASPQGPALESVSGSVQHDSSGIEEDLVGDGASDPGSELTASVVSEDMEVMVRAAATLIGGNAGRARVLTTAGDGTARLVSARRCSDLCFPRGFHSCLQYHVCAACAVSAWRRR